MAVRGIKYALNRFGVRVPRLVVHTDDTTPVFPAIHVAPTAEPTATGAKGDLYFDSTANALMQYTGSAWEQVGSTPSGNVTIGGTLAVTGATTLSSTLNYRAQVTDTGGAFATPIVLTAAQSGRILLGDDAAGLDFTLPAITADEVGIWYRFIVTVAPTSNSYRFTAQAADLLTGGVWMPDFDAAYNSATRDALWAAPDGSDDLIITMNGTTTGGKIGTDITILAVSATRWFVSGTIAADGVIATPFS